MTNVKKLVAALAAVVAAGAISVTAFAATPPYYFKFVCGERGGNAWSGEGEKKNNEQTATVNTTGGYVSSDSYIYINIYDENKSTILTNSAKVTSPKEEYTLDYKEEHLRGAGSKNYLHGNAGYYSAEVAGNWTP